MTVFQDQERNQRHYTNRMTLKRNKVKNEIGLHKKKGRKEGRKKGRKEGRREEGRKEGGKTLTRERIPRFQRGKRIC